jgi:hypothetical protein
MPLSPAWPPPAGMAATTTDNLGLINGDPGPHHVDGFMKVEPNLFDICTQGKLCVDPTINRSRRNHERSGQPVHLTHAQPCLSPHLHAVRLTQVTSQ